MCHLCQSKLLIQQTIVLNHKTIVLIYQTIVPVLCVQINMEIVIFIMVTTTVLFLLSLLAFDV